ncbi:putative dephospho-CoA kinase [Sugiyamaella lignohabitans]|uniref:Putative dephospho-CoA kinase n=1 Tax=Sugiyamaella lignohabitans TaxID=796027 RepID=A0A167CG21_9ASCO|nr:putative dephospho-CoA kinase [Sugiyamaella lignohabitans]ANB11642.1 putative dephospho-CoA kinase [Sugiyamaella lignohabitans]
MLIVGLTGGIATGKSTVSKYLAQKHNLTIVDADLIARQVVEPGTKAYKQIVDHFTPLVPEGQSLVDENGNLNRPVLGKVAFGSEKERKVLNSITHPAVRLEMARQVIWAWVKGCQMVILDVPLLFESKLDAYCGVSVVVSCSNEQQRERLLKRDPHLSEDDADKRIASQMPIAEKRLLADYVIKNEASLDSLYAKLDALVSQMQPNIIISLSEWLLPPIGFIVALYIYIKRKNRVKSKLS